MKGVAVLCGGTSGAKIVGALYRNGINVKAIVNTGDDEYFLGLYVSPDFDSVLYSLAGIFDYSKNWGILGDTFNSYEMMKKMGVEPYIMLGDKDLAVHIYRTYLLSRGYSLTEVFNSILKAFNINVEVSPPTDQRIRTMVGTEKGEVTFEEYYVKRLQDKIKYVKVEGSGGAEPSEKALEILEESELLIFAPSNPLASIFPIISVKGIRERIKRFKGKRVAISPFKGGVTFKGPASKMMLDLGFEPSAEGLYKLYKGLVDLIVVDKTDFKEEKIGEARVIPADITINRDEDFMKIYNLIVTS